MNIGMARSFLLWCTLINYGILVLWALLFLAPNNPLNRLSARLSRLTVEQFAALNYGGIVLYKLGIILFNLVPLIALSIVG